MKLTKRSIDGLAWREGGPPQQIVYDDELPGFGLRLYPTGARTFVLKYRTKDGRRSRLHTIGRYGVLTLDQARDRARRRLVEIMDGADPVSSGRAARQASTFTEFASDYVERHAKRRKKSWQADERRLNRHILPALGSLKLAAVKRADVARMHLRIGETHPYEANRALALVSAIFTKAEEWGAVVAGNPNPARGVERFIERSRDRWVTEQELPALLAAINREPSHHARAALLLYLLTGLRRNEVLGLRWEFVDLERREIRIPDTKAGRPHVVPLSPAALEVLTNVPRFLGNPYVVASPVKPGAPWADLKSVWGRVRERVAVELWSASNPELAAELRAQTEGLVDADDRTRRLVLKEIEARGEKVFDVRVHDLRRTVGSWLAMSGASLPLIGKVLNHSNVSTTQVYARLAEDLSRRALDEHGRRIMSVADAASTTMDDALPPPGVRP